MAQFTAHDPGTFCWVELMTTDGDGAKSFYQKLFGWQTHDDPVGEGMVYTMLLKDGRNVAALYPRNTQQQQAGVPPNWTHYVSVADADATAARARKHGGRIVLEPVDIYDIGRMAIFQDPGGATLGIWQPKRSIGAQIRGESGSFCWNELMTRDPGKAGAFLQQVFDWQAQDSPMGGTSYTMFINGGQPTAGMIEIQREWGEMSSNWLVYFAVDGCDATVAMAVATGGSLMAGPYDIEVGRIALIRDPQGAPFGITELKM
jgi:predicted enzyme related to lactoylglutathione lyase